MPDEDDAEHVVNFPFQPVGAAPQVDHRLHFERFPLIKTDLDSEIGSPVQ
jgi:hypothetical protein